MQSVQGGPKNLHFEQVPHDDDDNDDDASSCLLRTTTLMYNYVVILLSFLGSTFFSEF